MESFAFPDEIKMKFIRLKIYKMGNIFMPPKITQKAQQDVCHFSFKHQENTIFYFDCCSEGNA